MPRRLHSTQVFAGDVPGALPPLAERQEQAAQLLTHAHQLLARVAEERQAIEQCVAVLQQAPTKAYFFYHPDPPTLIAAVGQKAGTQAATTLYTQLTAALHHIPARIELIRLNTLFALHHLGVPVALWYFLNPGPLPATVAALAPTGARGPSPTGHSPPTYDSHALPQVVSPTD